MSRNGDTVAGDMKTFPLNAFDSLADAQPVAAITAKVTKVFPQKTGESSAGPWAIQNLEIEGDGVVLPVMMKDRDPVGPELKGRTITLIASTGKQMAGLYAMDDNRNGTVIRKLKVTASATMEVMEGSAPASKPAQNTNVQQAAQSAVNQAQRAAGTTQTADLGAPAERPAPKGQDEINADQAKQERHDIRDVRKTMIQVANLHLLARLSVENYEAKLFKDVTGKDMSEGEIQGATASVFIKCEKIGLHSKMPARPFTLDELKK